MDVGIYPVKGERMSEDAASTTIMVFSSLDCGHGLSTSHRRIGTYHIVSPSRVVRGKWGSHEVASNGMQPPAEK